MIDSIEPEPSTRLTIDLDAIVANYRFLQSFVALAKMVAVVKADAYGLGMARVAPALAAAGCARFCVAFLTEAIELRRLLPEAEIAVLHGFQSGEENLVLAERLIPVLNDRAQIASWQKLCRDNGAAYPAELHVDTGMYRLGLLPSEFATLLEDNEFLRFPWRQLISHLACADDPEHSKNREQRVAFQRIRQALPHVPASLAASYGIFLGSDFHFDVVRPGGALYGAVSQVSGAEKLRPVVSLNSRILSFRRVDAGETVGYGAAYYADIPRIVATLPIGYADGLFRLGNQNPTASRMVWLGAYGCPIIGRVSMDLVTIDVTNVPTELVHIGAKIEIIGPHQTIEQWAAMNNTITYEILTALGGRYQRHYSGGEA